MPTLDEIGNAEQTTVTDIPVQGEFDHTVGVDVPQQNDRIKEILSKFLTAETGAGAIEDYIDHPLNFLKSKGFAQMLRGFTGIFGSLSLAVIDIALGSLQFSKERKQGAVMNDVSNGGGFPS